MTPRTAGRSDTIIRRATPPRSQSRRPHHLLRRLAAPAGLRHHHNAGRLPEAENPLPSSPRALSRPPHRAPAAQPPRLSGRTKRHCPRSHRPRHPSQSIRRRSPPSIAAIVLFGLERHQDPQSNSYNQSLRLNPQHPEAHNNRGSALHALKQFPAALESYDNAIRLNPNYVEAYRNRGNTLYELQQYQQSLESSDQAIRLNPSYAEAHYNRGNALQALQRYAEAVASYDHAIRLKPDYTEAFSNRGNALYFLEQNREAIQSCDQAIHLNPDNADAHLNRGNALYLLEQRDREAIKSCDQAYILLKPDFADAHCNRGNALLALKQYPDALESYNRALNFNPSSAYVPGIRLHMKGFLCDWRDFESECRQLEAAIARGEKAAVPFAVLPVINSPATQRQAAEIYARDQAPALPAAAMPHLPRREKIRIGYFSADYYTHATSCLIAELLERHDRTRFEILGFSFGPDTADAMSQRVSASMDRFINVRSLPDRDIAKLSRELEVDIAVDLKGFTRDSRPGIFAQRAAPIQINFLGYPGTAMAASYIDYLIADPTLIPQSSQPVLAPEKIVHLPRHLPAATQNAKSPPRPAPAPPSASPKTPSSSAVSITVTK